MRLILTNAAETRTDTKKTKLLCGNKNTKNYSRADTERQKNKQEYGEEC